MSLETYTVTKAYPGASLGADVQMDSDSAAAHVSGGFLAKKDAAAQAAADNSLVGLIDLVAKSALQKAHEEYVAKARSESGGAPFNLAGNPAVPKDDGSLGEWLWAAAGQAQTFDPNKREHCKHLLLGKYRTGVNSNFGSEWQGAQRKGAGGLGTAQAGLADAHSKASVQVENVGSLGGLLVPPQFSAEFFRLAEPQSIFMSRCKRYTMTGKELWIPGLDYSTGAAGVSPYLGGMNAVWTGENQGFTQENANVRQVKLNANLLAGYTQSSRTLLADSQVSVEQVLTGLFAQAIAYNVDQAVFNGDGVDKPLGMIKSGACATFSRGTWTTNGLLLKDLAIADSKLIPELEADAIWVVPPSFKQNLYPMTDASGKVVFLANFPASPQGAATVRPSMAVFGKPVFWSQLPASAATAGSVNLLIPSLYALGMRQEIEIAVSEHVAFTSNLLTWRFLFRGDGQSLLNTTLTLQNADVVAPFVSIN